MYAAFVDPDQLRRFWLAHASGPLRTGSQVTWTFKIAGAVTDVVVVEAVANRLLDLRWDSGQPLRLEFEDRGEATVVRIRHSGFGEDPNIMMATTSGLTLMLASLKTWLEHGIEAELIYDSFPDAQYSDR